ncbi:hypothetical protein LX15_001534 [Streptoalloteichus tenebrarius]|uniref:Cell wall anchor protein n=1 Tax=Streptoalloteichus tenebrarius (strain ATCC 17920 / DSM 40477 / JCM 4838 / CBS 697.72 / NBRC 16177 / NCIMB 11028 / NRRL B-12390 / A12253. 1 / ISP 5477) TaxID=1933 RepID=A0ABT1HQS3_STRSD|nr:DUF6319 family protein [Streptoalloteichus tenebrarius]MCP2257848.1 hypothetical protein [Streptoalloteichus tenebrarius]BFE99790.1 hypothetical protein GCM10020241_14660 [Streptoalloteichus tenebrarius]
MPRPRPLSQEELDQLRAELGAGQQPTVWFTSAAVGVEAGRSGRVVDLGDPADGDFIQVRPTGSKDVLSFSATEVTMTKPERKKKAAGPRGGRAAASVAAAATPAPSVEAAVAPAAQEAPARPATAPPAPTRTTPPAPAGAPAAAPTSATAEPARSPARRGGRKPAEPPAVVVTLTSTSEGEWTVEVVTGKKRAVRGLSVGPGAVAQAARALHPEVSSAIETVLEAARERQRARVEQLQAELEAARRMLAELAE